MGEQDIVKVESVAGGLVPSALVESAQSYARDAKAAGTRAAYQKAWRTFSEWCIGHGLAALPATPETVALYLTARADAGRKPATLGKELAAIAEAHKVAGHPSPRSAAPVRLVLQGIRRRVGVAQRQVAPLLPADLRRILREAPPGLLSLQDRAIMILGFGAALRRSELVALDVADLTFVSDGLEVVLRRSKTDQEAHGRKIGVPYGSDPNTCPVRSMKAWLEAAVLVDGAVFRPVSRHGKLLAGRLTDRGVARAVKRGAARVGIDPSKVSGLSLRAGLATAAARAGKPAHVIARQTGHKSLQTVQRYIRDADIFNENAASGIGL